VVALLAALLAGLGLLPKAKSYVGVVAVVAVLAALLAITETINLPAGFAIACSTTHATSGHIAQPIAKPAG
ncbi:DUF5336 domain-containing protein, partial [Mycobacterium avium]|uniref:DUF5336 domain-containing protein n=1 Tax=Mycobacterium avium TaxID=1764 RepID=UPI001F25972B